MPPLRVAILQLDYPAGETRGDRIARVAELLGATPTADLLVLPELWDVGYFAFEDYETEAEPLEAGPAARLAAVAAALGCTVVAGSVIERAGNDLYNTTLVLGNGGARLGEYRKMHLFHYGSREGQLLTPGPGPIVTPTPAGLLGLATCFDLRFPEQFAAMTLAGADLFVVPSAWPTERVEAWRVLVQARAIETQTPIVAANGVGPCHGTDLAGSSMVVDARGSVILDAGRQPGWHLAELDPDDTAAWRREFPMRASGPAS